MSVEQRLSELQSKAQAVADECHRLGLLVNQGVKTTDSPDFAGLTVGSNTVWHAGNDGAGRVGRPIVHWTYKASSGSGWWRVFSFTPTGGIYNTSVVHISAFSSTSGLVDRSHWELVLSGVPNGDLTYSSAYLRSFGNITPDMFQLRYSTTTGEYTLFFNIPQFTDYGLYITFPKAPCPYSLHNSAMEPQGDVNIEVEPTGTPVPLWAGSWSSGNISVPSIHKYEQFLIQTSANARIVVRASRVPGDTLVLGDGWWGSLQVMAGFSTYTNGATFDGCLAMGHPSSAVHGATTNFAITAIYGLT